MTWIDPGKTDPADTTTFAFRLYEQLEPFQALDTEGHLWALCDGIYAMFQEMEELTKERDDGLPGYANMLDIDACRADFLAWLGQFVGAVQLGGLTEAQQRQYIASLPGFSRGRPDTVKSVVAATLTGTKTVDLRERTYVDAGGVWQTNAWRYTVITKPSETPNLNVTLGAIQDQKPGPDIAFYLGLESVSYAWVKDTYATYADLKAGQATYADLKNAII